MGVPRGVMGVRGHVHEIDGFVKLHWIFQSKRIKKIYEEMEKKTKERERERKEKKKKKQEKKFIFENERKRRRKRKKERRILCVLVVTCVLSNHLTFILHSDSIVTKSTNSLHKFLKTKFFLIFQFFFTLFFILLLLSGENFFLFLFYTPAFLYLFLHLHLHLRHL